MSTHLHFETSNAPLLFTDSRNCSRIWRLLYQRFPEAYAAVLLPDSGHLLVPESCTEVAQYRLQIALRSAFPGVIWKSPLPPLPRIGSARTLSSLRQILHQPVRQGLCEDPCSWTWSSSLDLIGAIHCPWMTPESIARRLGPRREKFREQLFNYLSVSNARSFNPPEPSPLTGKKPPHTAAEILAALALSRRQTPFETLQTHPMAAQLWSHHLSRVTEASFEFRLSLSPAEQLCLSTPILAAECRVDAAYSALSSDTGNSGRALRSHASTTAGVASSNRGWMMERVV